MSGGARVRPHDLEAQSPRGPSQDEVDDEDRREGDEQADVDARARDVRQQVRNEGRLRQWRRRVVERPLDQDARDVDADEGHHQRGDDLVRPVAGLQQRRDHRPGTADGAREEKQNGERNPERHVADERRAVAGDERRGKQELPVVAEVPDVGAEDHRQPGRDQQERGHPDRTVLPAALLDSALPDVPVEVQRIPAEPEQQEPTGDERERDGHDRADEDVEQPLRPPGAGG